MKFTKMHGCGNDYVYVNCLEERILHPDRIARYVSDRHFGIGSDGMILICPSEKADFRMEMYNADGSEGKMCGNGVRCIAKYVYDYGLTDQTSISLETKGGIKQLDMTTENGKVVSVRVNMGSPVLEPEKIPVDFEGEQMIDEPVVIGEKKYCITGVSMGNPHGVIFVDDTESLNLPELGPRIERHKLFPERANIEFVQWLNQNEIRMRVWERGSGETLACGTGACASVVAGVLTDRTKERVVVHVRGGDLEIHYDRKENIVWMTGPATVVFDGEIDISQIDSEEY